MPFNSAVPICPKVGPALSLLANRPPPEEASGQTSQEAEALGRILSLRFRTYGPDAGQSISQLATTAGSRLISALDPSTSFSPQINLRKVMYVSASR